MRGSVATGSSSQCIRSLLTACPHDLFSDLVSDEPLNTEMRSSFLPAWSLRTTLSLDVDVCGCMVWMIWSNKMHKAQHGWALWLENF